MNVKSTLMIDILAPLHLPLYLRKVTFNSLIRDAECSMFMILRNMSKMCLKDMHAGGFYNPNTHIANTGEEDHTSETGSEGKGPDVQ